MSMMHHNITFSVVLKIHFKETWLAPSPLTCKEMIVVCLLQQNQELVSQSIFFTHTSKVKTFFTTILSFMSYRKRILFDNLQNTTIGFQAIADIVLDIRNLCVGISFKC